MAFDLLPIWNTRNHVDYCLNWSRILNSPSNNRFISEREAKYLALEIRRARNIKSIPWQSILTSKPIYACLCAQYAYNFSSTLMQTFLPTYFRDELMIPLSMNGVYTMIPFLVQTVVRTCCSIVADALIRKVDLCPIISFLIYLHAGAIGLAVSLISLAYFPTCDQPWIAAICLVFYGIAYSFGIPGYLTALMSIAPQH
ncbi:hypothetical protein PENTCL1PPCAC_14932, partial [Pristionchus entomophagus]